MSTYAIPERPRVFLDTTYTPQPGKRIAVPAGGDLKAALAAAVPGDTVELEAGATWTGNFDLPPKPNPDGRWIHIVGSALDRLPAPGVQIDPATDAAALPKIVTTNINAALKAGPGSGFWRLVGIECAVAEGVPLSYDLVDLGDTRSQGQDTIEEVPTDFTFDRCSLHGNATGQIPRGIAANAARVAMVDSVIDRIHQQGADSTCFAAWNSPGPFKLVNCLFSGGAEGVMFGGGDSAVEALMPADIEFRRNLVTKPLNWNPADPSFDGVGGDKTKKFVVKNAFELKAALRVLVDGNTFEHAWPPGQVGFLVVLTPRNQGGNAPWSTVEDVTLTNNIVRHGTGGVNLLGTDNLKPSGRLSRVLIQNNLFDDIGGTWGANVSAFQITAGVVDLTLDRNTVLEGSTSQLIFFGGAPAVRLRVTGNILARGKAGVSGNATAEGLKTLAAYAPDAVVTGNAIIGASAVLYPPGNSFPKTLDEAKATPGCGADEAAIAAAMLPPVPPPPPPAATIEELTAALTAMTAERDALATSLRTAEFEVSALEGMNLSLNTDLATMTAERDAALAVEKTLQNRLNATTEELVSVSTAYDEARALAEQVVGLLEPLTV